MAEDIERRELNKLPSVSELEDGVRKKVMRLMDALADVTEKQTTLAIQEDELKDQLEQIQRETGKEGFKYGDLTFRAQEMPGRKTLDKMALLENGVSVQVLEASYKTGKPYMRVSFKDIQE